MKKIRQKLQEMRGEVIDGIREIIDSVGFLRILDIDEGCSPILQEDSFDGNNTYTLDRIYIENDKLCFDGSSSYANYTWNQDNLDVIMLIGILEFLEDHENEVEELKEYNYA